MPHAQTTLTIIRDGPAGIQKIMEENMKTVLIEGMQAPIPIKLILFSISFFCNRECSMGANGTPKDQNYVHGYPKPLSPVLRATHLHYSNEASGESFF